MTRSARSAVLAAASVLALLGTTAAQAQHAAEPGHRWAQAASDAPRVDARQQARIADGVADGSLTRHEARHLQRQQQHIRHAERHARADGVVTAHERRHLDALQDRASRSIHRLRHDAQHQPRRAG